MLEKFKKTFDPNSNIEDIAATLISSSYFKNRLGSYSTHPYDANFFFDIDNNSFHLASVTSCEGIKSIPIPELALTTSTREAGARLACAGARYISVDNSQEPILKMIGIFKDESSKTKMSFQNKGEIIYIVSTKYPEDEYRGPASEIFLTMVAAIENGYITSAHHINAYQGLFLSLLEAGYPSKLGFDITTGSEMTEIEFLFGICGYIAIISVNDEQENDFVDFMFNNDVQITLLGHVTKGDIRVDEKSYGHINDILR